LAAVPLQKAWYKNLSRYPMDLLSDLPLHVIILLQDDAFRYKHGELYNADSIKFVDSLKYFTNARRIVYGGGGIMPDIFVPLDTSQNSRYHSDLIRKSVLYEFALSYTDRNRKKLVADYPDVNTFKNKFRASNELIEEAVAYGEKKGVPRDSTGLKTSYELMRIQLAALIARDLWDTNAYWQVINQINHFYIKAMEFLRDDTFDKLKIANN
jgi:carboxyl-terminal processing protease